MRHYKVVLDDVLVAHREALSYGGRPGIVSIGLVESAIARPYSGYHREIWRKSAALMEALVKNHGFTDGNKRTALIVTELLIRRSGYRLLLQPDEKVDDVIVDLAMNAIEFDDLAHWFRARLTRVE